MSRNLYKQTNYICKRTVCTRRRVRTLHKTFLPCELSLPLPRDHNKNKNKDNDSLLVLIVLDHSIHATYIRTLLNETYNEVSPYITVSHIIMQNPTGLAETSTETDVTVREGPNLNRTCTVRRKATNRSESLYQHIAACTVRRKAAKRS
jgi:DNA-binding helix-hairpin-helix protein with protein kinase domain